MVQVKKTDEVTPPSLPLGPSALVWTKETYQFIAKEFHSFHQHDLNAFLHLITTGLGVWGVIQLACVNEYIHLVYAYGLMVLLTTPLTTGVLHTAFLYACCQVNPYMMPSVKEDCNANYICASAIVLGYGLQDLAHYLCDEPTYLNSYIWTKPYMLLFHTFYLMPLVIDSILLRNCFLPHVPHRNRNVVTRVAQTQAVNEIREWINETIPSTPETTHVWPHAQEGTDQATVLLEQDAAILAGFRTVFPAKHYDIRPVVGMNEIYVTAVGSKKEINSDAVFYTPHTDGPYWFLPQASLYRVLVGLTPNQMVRTRFNLQHESQDQVVDMYDVLGFDYSRELHWIDHVPGKKNQERRSLMKLHFVVYPKGWHRYGKLAAALNTNYNTWARNNFLRTLRPKSIYEYTLAWWIWLTTWTNAIWEEHVGWSNLVYIAMACALGPTALLILTSFRHYTLYITTFAYREPAVAHGYLMRDAKLYKTISMMHLARRLLPLVQLPRDVMGLVIMTLGFATTILATARLGMVRTYFGTELGFVKPKWISGFPYGTIPHPMIVGQLIAFGTILNWYWNELTTSQVQLLVAHVTCYTIHMVQEMLTSSY